jgi:hypothetical protein
MSLRPTQRIALVACAFIAAAIIWRATHHPRPRLAPTTTAPAMQQEPLTMLWAWETPEDIRDLDPTRTGVAFLSREVLLANPIQLRPRHQPLQLPPNTWLMADVRIDTAPNFTPTSTTAAEVAQVIAAAASDPTIRALQVDFDATASQRDLYTAILKDLRHDLPPQIPLSITALVSWCGTHSWLTSLPVTEAVPMFFRMGGPTATRATHPKDANLVTEPLCSGSAGIATDETWPAIHSGQRVYVFRSGSWTKEDLARINASGYQGLSASQK